MELKAVLEKIIERSHYYLMYSDQRHWFGGHQPIPERYAPGGIILGLSAEEREVLKNAKPEDFQSLRMDFVLPHLFYEREPQSQRTEEK